MIDIYKRYTILRQKLQPYIVAAAAQARSGMPIVRPMPFYDRRDPKLADLWDEYLFGPDLLVAPVWQSGQDGRTVYFPRGTWQNYWDPKQKLHGRRVVKFPVPLDTILVFKRTGSTVPGP
jgi:alpha-glucosidase (family GH31 glycosyl hydrolase)